jgi:hypothetical protein
MQPPPGFGAPTPSVPINVQQASTAVQAHTKFISAGSEIESEQPIVLHVFNKSGNEQDLIATVARKI